MSAARVKRVVIVTQAKGASATRQPRQPKDPNARFWKFVNKNGPIKREDLGACWEWTGARMADGYGLFRFEGKLEGAHRISYILKHGPIPDGKMLLHACDNPPCVNPDHTSPGTNADNLGDMAQKGRARGGRRTKDGREPRNRRAGAASGGGGGGGTAA